MNFNFRSLGLVLFSSASLLLQMNAQAEEISPNDFTFSGPSPAQLGESYDFNIFQKRTDYPEQKVSLYWLTGSNTFNSELPQIAFASAATKFIDSETVATTTVSSNFRLAYSYVPSANSYYKVDLTNTRYTVPNDFSATSRKLRLVSSTVDLLNLRLAASAKCWNWDNKNQFCLGYQAVYDSMAVIPFQKNHLSSTQITVTALKDLQLGLHMTYSKEFVSELLLTSTLNYEYGMGLSQGSNITTSGSTVGTFALNVAYPWQHFIFTAGLDASSSRTPVSNGSEKWNVKNDNASAVLGVGWEF